MSTLSRRIRLPLCTLLLLGLGLLAGCGEKPDNVPANADRPAPANSGPAIFDPEGLAEVNKDLPIPAPDFKVATLEGNEFTLADQRGKVVLVNFWATWCGPCVIEIPDLQRLYNEYGDEGLTVLGVSVEDGDVDLVRDFVAMYEMTYPVAISMDLTEQFGGVYGLPTTFVIDKEGQIVERVIGLFPTEKMTPRLEELLKG